MIPTLYEPFRHWSENGSVYILSDLHFDDEDCQIMSPNWISPQEQISIINGTVMKNDTLICLGDVGRPEYMKDIKARKKILILGNHDAKGAYKKLVRDRIPEIIKNDGKDPIIKILSNEEYLKELDKKLNEEVAEYQSDKSLEEMADILEVLFAICEARGHSIDELMCMREIKKIARGGFDERIFWVGNE